MNWYTWLECSWEDLELGGKLAINRALLLHPAVAGFRELPISEPNGQARDWGWSLDDGSRIHVHEHADGSLVAHRDKYDPDRSAENFVKHILLETKAGKVGLAVGAAVLLYRAARA